MGKTRNQKLKIITLNIKINRHYGYVKQLHINQFYKTFFIRAIPLSAVSLTTLSIHNAF